MPVQLRQRIDALLWHPRIPGLHPVLRGLVLILRFLYAVVRDAITGDLTLHATGLVYVTILSLVPLLAVSFSVLKAFGFQRQLQPVLYDLFEPLGTRGEELTTRIIGFVDNVHGDVLAGVGLLVLFFTAVSMAEKVEGSFNYIWRVERPRSIARRVSEYLSVILVGPVVMVTAMALIAKLSRLRLLRRLGVVAAFQDGGMLDQVAPYALVCLAFTVVFWFVPNTRVRIQAAAVGGICGGILWAGTGALFANYVVEATNTISIYATFAVVIMALVWLYLCWLILLIGSQLAFYVQNPEYLALGYRPLVTGTGQQEEMALGIMLMVGRAFREERGATELARVAQTAGLPGLVLAPVVAQLESAGLLVRTSDDRLVPGRDPAHIRLQEIVAAIREPLGADVRREARWPASLHTLRDEVEAAVDASLGNRTLADLVSEQAEAPADR